MNNPRQIERDRNVEYREVPNTTPDPSVRTIEQLQREVSALKELHGVRLEAMDKAIQVAHDDLVRVPTDVQKAVEALRNVLLETFRVHDEKFESVQKQFVERDTRTDKIADLSQKALDAALLTAEKAVGKQSEAFAAATAKSEAAFTKQIDGIVALLNSGLKASDDKIIDLKGRIDRGEGKVTGHGEIWGWLFGGIGMLTGIVIVIIELIKH
jgi:hypothetical protein